MITRIYLHIYITYIIHYHGKTRQTSGRGDCGGIVTKAVTSCDTVESEYGIPYKYLQLQLPPLKPEEDEIIY
jgi:hypothetical protein